MEKSNAAQLITLPEIFYGRFFRIPDYQRGYSWEEEQLLDLKRDILNYANKNHKHFTGTLVAAKKPNGDYYDIVDGQQRIATLVMLLNEIYRKNPEDFKEIPNLYLKRGSIGNEISVFEPNEESRLFFDSLVYRQRSSEILNKSHHNIENAVRFCKKWVADPDTNVKLLYRTITEKLGFIFFSPLESKELGVMFEVINNRGKKLSELEKIKNYFIYFSTIHEKDSLKQKINDSWTEIHQNLNKSDRTSNAEEDRFVRYCYLVFYASKKNYSQNVYDILKSDRYKIEIVGEETIDSQVKEMESFLNFISAASRYYKYLFSPGEFNSTFNHDPSHSRVDKTLRYLRCQPIIASIMPLYLALMHKFEMADHSSKIKIADLLELLEKVNFRLYILPGVFRRADSKQSEMFNFANLFYSNNLSEEKENVEGTQFDLLGKKLTEMITKYCPVQRFVESLTLDNDEDYDYYQWRDSGLRYFLACYEESLKNKSKLDFNIERILIRSSDAKELSNEYLSIEHIWAKENRKEDFGPDFKEKRRLGNLVLMGLNSNRNLTNDDIEEKIKQLDIAAPAGSGALDMHQVAEIREIYESFSKDDFSREWRRQGKNYHKEVSMLINDAREHRLIKYALKRWFIDGDIEIKNLVINSIDAEKEKKNTYFSFKDDLDL